VLKLFGQLTAQDSLNCLESDLATQEKSLCHFEKKHVSLATLAYANEHRSNNSFQKLFFLEV
jgi:hypothetical protein